MTHTLTDLPLATAGTSAWMQDRLAEARGVLADIAHHPQSLVILAARVVAGQSDCTSECAEAANLLQVLERQPTTANASVAVGNGGAS